MTRDRTRYESTRLDPTETKEGGDEDESPAEGRVGLHFVKLRPEPVTGGNIRSLVQVRSCPRSTVTHFVPLKLPRMPPNRCHARTPSRVTAVPFSLPDSVTIRERLVFLLKRSPFASTYPSSLHQHRRNQPIARAIYS